jgi:hypothetical protein
MSHAYTTKERVKLLAVPEADLVNTEQANRIDALIVAVSKFVDRYCGRPIAYFLGATGTPVAAVRRYRGGGYNFLQIGQHFGPAVITSPATATSVYYEDENGWLQWTQETDNGQSDFYATEYTTGFFGRNVLYLVSATWGFETTPEDVDLATALIVGDIWDRGNGVIGQISPTGFVVEKEIPLQARVLLDQRKRREFEVN